VTDPDSATGPRQPGKKASGGSCDAGRWWVLGLASTAVTFLAGLLVMYVLIPGNRFDATPWHQDDFNFLFAPTTSVSLLSVRPVSTGIALLLAKFGALGLSLGVHFFVFANIALVYLLWVRALRPKLGASVILLGAASTSAIVGLLPDTPALPKYVGNLSHTSVFFALLSLLVLLESVDRENWWLAGVAWALGVVSFLAKEDTIPFMVLGAALIWLRAAPRAGWKRAARRGVLFEAALLVAIAALFLGEAGHSFLWFAIRGGGHSAYQLHVDLPDIALAAQKYALWAGSFVVLYAAFAAVLVLAAFRGDRRLLVYGAAAAGLYSSLLLPYLLLGGDRYYGFYRFNWFGLGVAFVVVGGFKLVTESGMRPPSSFLVGLGISALAVILLLNLDAQARNDSLAWHLLMQRRSRATMASLKAALENPAVSRASRIYVTGVDDLPDPFWTNGAYLDHVLGRPGLKWYVLAAESSPLVKIRRDLALPAQNGQIVYLAGPVAQKGAGYPRLDFDPASLSLKIRTRAD
jgi:hypothetical protein